MIFIVGLGNPGEKFQKTRHNIGFQVLDEFQKENDFPDFKLLKKFNSLVSAGNFTNKEILLVKPQTFMNNSGQAVKKLVSSFRFQVSRIWVVHDDIDLPLGKIRISKGRGSAGHKGVESIIKELGTKDFIRFRTGIKPTNNEQRTMNNTEKFVLEKFFKDEEKIIKKIIKTSCGALKTALTQGSEKAMSKFNK